MASTAVDTSWKPVITMTCGASGILLQRPQHLDALDARHLHVEQQDVGHLLLQLLERGVAVGDADRRVALARSARARGARAGSSRRRRPARGWGGHGRASAGAAEGRITRNVAPAPGREVHLDAPAVVGHDPLGDGEPEPGALPGRLGREEGVEDARQDVGRGCPGPRRRRRSPPRARRAGRVVTVSVPRPSIASSALPASPRKTWRSWPSLATTTRQRGVEIGDRAGSRRSATGGSDSSSALSTSTFRSAGARRLPGSRTNCSRLPVISLQR